MPNNIFKKHTMSEAADIWVKSQKNYWKPGTYTVYMQRLTKYILPFFGNMKLSKITEKTMEDFVLYLTSQSKNAFLSENYISQICGTVRRILTYMEKNYHCNILVPSNPATKKHSRRIILPESASLHTLEHYLFTHCEEDTCLGILIAFHTGIRIGELSALTWRDINLQEGLIYIQKNILRVKNENARQSSDCKMTQVIKQSPKTSDSSRTVPLPEQLIPILSQYKKEISK